MAENKSCSNEGFCNQAAEQLRYKDMTIENLKRRLEKEEQENEKLGLDFLKQNEDIIKITQQ